MNDAELEALELRLRERAMLRRFPWLAAVLIGTFALWNEYHVRYYWYVFQALKTNPPLPTQAAYAMSKFGLFVTPVLIVLATIVYFTKRRIVMKTFLIILFGLFAGQLFAEALPLLIVQKALHTN